MDLDGIMMAVATHFVVFQAGVLIGIAVVLRKRRNRF